MSARRCPPVGSPLLTLALAGLAYGACISAAVAWRLYLYLRPDPPVKP
jgi:hypothetical protein